MLFGCTQDSNMPEKPNPPGTISNSKTVGGAIANLADFSDWATGSFAFETSFLYDSDQIVLTIICNDDIALKDFYVWNEGTMFWDLYQFDGDAVEGWIMGGVEKEILLPKSVLDENGEIFVLGYSCSDAGDGYDCHTDERWQMTVPRVGMPNVPGASCVHNQDCRNTMFCNVDSCLVETGVCTESPETCDSAINKVCGCDGITYDNACLAAKAKSAVAYAGKCLPEAPQAHGTNDENCPGKAPETKCVTVSLLTSKGRPIQGAEAKYYEGSTLKSFGTTDATGKSSKEMQQGKYNFEIRYEGTSSQLTNININDFNKLVKFKTNEAKVLFKDPDGNPKFDGLARYLAGREWRDIGFTDEGYATVELVPASYNFEIDYDGRNNQRIQVSVRDATAIEFQTQYVTVLVEKDGMPLANAKVTYLVGGTYKEGGTTDPSGEVVLELLPGTYNFYAHYEGNRADAIQRDIIANPFVTITFP